MSASETVCEKNRRKKTNEVKKEEARLWSRGNLIRDALEGTFREKKSNQKGRGLKRDLSKGGKERVKSCCLPIKGTTREGRKILVASLGKTKKNLRGLPARRGRGGIFLEHSKRGVTSLRDARYEVCWKKRGVWESGGSVGAGPITGKKRKTCSSSRRKKAN